MNRSAIAAFAVTMLLGSLLQVAAALPDFATDEEADRWFRAHSAAYRRMAAAVDAAGGYTIRANAETPGGLAYFENGRGYIEINPRLNGPRRFSILIYEVTNLWHERKHQEVADRVRRGELDDPKMFALLRETIEYDGIRLHHQVLKELEPVLKVVPAEMITWLSSTARSFAEYDIPFVHDYLRAQEASGHTAHFVRLFDKHRAEFLAAQRGNRGQARGQ